MKNLALPRIQAMKPYSPPLTGRRSYDGLLLDFNERTLQTSVDLGVNLRPQLYPEYSDLTEKIASYAEVESRQVMITNGTDQAIDIIFRSFADVSDKVIIPEPSFAMFSQAAKIAGNQIVSPEYSKGSLAFPVKAILKVIDKQTKLIVICNPNNPTGTLASLSDIEAIAKQASEAVVYIDEAYFEFSKYSAVGLITKYPNIIVSRTFSKAFGLAGLRIGYVIANEQYINEMLKVRGPYDVNQLACYAASAALSDTSTATKYASEVMDRAKPLVEQFFEQNNIPFYPSAGNFILFRPVNPDKVAKTLQRNGVLLRPQNKTGIEGTLRVTIGTVSQMEQFIKVYKTEVLGAGQKYALLDRDGTLIYEPQDTYQIDSLDKLQILEGVTEGLSELRNRGYKLVMVSNQDGLGTSSFPKTDFEAPQKAMLKTFQKSGIEFDQVFICPHLPSANCNCRKPNTGLLDDFLKINPINTTQSFVCGDRASDKGLAKRLGLRFVDMPTNGNFYEAIKGVKL